MAEAVAVPERRRLAAALWRFNRRMEGEPIVALVYGGMVAGFGVNELVKRDQMAGRAHLSFLAGGIVVAWGFWAAF